jgi:hypothetical protein
MECTCQVIGVVLRAKPTSNGRGYIVHVVIIELEQGQDIPKPAQIWFTRGYEMKFTFRCMICKKEFEKRIRHEEHLNTHSKKELIASLKYAGFYYNE